MMLAIEKSNGAACAACASAETGAAHNAAARAARVVFRLCVMAGLGSIGLYLPAPRAYSHLARGFAVHMLSLESLTGHPPGQAFDAYNARPASAGQRHREHAPPMFGLSGSDQP